MAFFELSRLREICLGSSTDSSEDTLLNAKGAQADAQVAAELIVSASNYGKTSALPSVNVTAGTVAGSTAPQNIKDSATDRAAGLFFLSRRMFEAAKPYMESSKVAVEAYIIVLQSDQNILCDNV